MSRDTTADTLSAIPGSSADSNAVTPDACITLTTGGDPADPGAPVRTVCWLIPAGDAAAFEEFVTGKHGCPFRTTVATYAEIAAGGSGQAEEEQDLG